MIAALTWALACSGDTTTDSATPPALDGPAQNVLIVLLDDVGVDKVTAYGEHPHTPDTPTLDRLARDGLLFRNAYANPSCSPTRASVLTGRHPSRTGIGRWISPWDHSWDLQDGEHTLPEVLAAAPQAYDSAAIGKWHLVSFLRDDPSHHAQLQGFATHRGPLANLKMAIQEDDADRGYTHWEKADQGTLSWETAYATTDTVDDAVAALATLESPWLLYVALNAPHIPIHEPPEHLLNTPLSEDPTHSALYGAMLEAADTELGRLLDQLTQEQWDTTALFVAGDNGTPKEAITEPFDATREKGTVYENGVRVPLFALGPSVSTPGGETDALVQLTDLFTTAAALGGVATDSLGADGLSLVPVLADPTATVRQVVYTEGFQPLGEPPYSTHERMVRSATHKLIHRDDDQGLTREFFRMDGTATDEGADLLAAGGSLSAQDELACAELEQAMADTVSGLVFGL